MAKRDWKEQKEDVKEEMTMEQARAYRASLATTVKSELTQEEKREAFRVFWAQAKAQYGKARDMEEILWLHLKATKMDKPEQFDAGLTHFGLTKIK